MSSVLDTILSRRTPARIAYAPNYWQWFAHHRNHGTLPTEIAHCRTQLDLIRHLGLDIFSRNIYCDEQRGWWGGLAEPIFQGLEHATREGHDGRDLVIEHTYSTPTGTLTERLRYVRAESTLVQEKFLVDDYESQLDAFAAFIQARRWRFLLERWAEWKIKAGTEGVVVAGEVCSPLKMLHILLGTQNATFFLMDQPERATELLKLHEAAMLDLVAQLVTGGVRVVMCMDNLDAAFHPPHYIEQYSASFYERAAQLCHRHGALLMIHACGRQRDNLKLIAGLGVDGLEGVAFPPLGDVELDEALRLAGDRFIATGGISAKEFERLQTRAEIFAYVHDLFARLRPYANRFILSASCNTPYNAPWEKIIAFRDAWREFGSI
jgi:uroporphyrinogen-III decarboxylase